VEEDYYKQSDKEAIACDDEGEANDCRRLVVDSRWTKARILTQRVEDDAGFENNHIEFLLGTAVQVHMLTVRGRVW
jgi:hypothetical protein